MQETKIKVLFISADQNTDSSEAQIRKLFFRIKSAMSVKHHEFCFATPNSVQRVLSAGIRPQFVLAFGSDTQLLEGGTKPGEWFKLDKFDAMLTYSLQEIFTDMEKKRASWQHIQQVANKL